MNPQRAKLGHSSARVALCAAMTEQCCTLIDKRPMEIPAHIRGPLHPESLLSRAITTGERPDIIANIDRKPRFYQGWPLSCHDDVPIAGDSGVTCVIEVVRKFFFAVPLLRIAASIEF